MAVDVPALPTPSGHSLRNWKCAFLDQTKVRHYELCVTHSLGTAFALRLLESAIVSVDTLVSVAGCIGRTDIPRYDELNMSFVKPPFNWGAINEALGASIVVYSDDDPYIDAGQSRRLQTELNGTSIVLEAAGHINAAAGYFELHVLQSVFDAVCVGDARPARP